MADPAACAEAWRQGFVCHPAYREQWWVLSLGVAVAGLLAAGFVGWLMWRGWRGRW